jgi:hypothetical protein
MVSPHGIDSDCNHGNFPAASASSEVTHREGRQFETPISTRGLTSYRVPDGPYSNRNAGKRDAAVSSHGSSGTSPSPARTGDRAPASCSSAVWNVAVLDLAWFCSLSVSLLRYFFASFFRSLTNTHIARINRSFPALLIVS